MSEPDKPDLELDAKVAELLGWEAGQDAYGLYFDNGKTRIRPQDWHPSTDIAAAWEVLAVVRTGIFSKRHQFVWELQRAIAIRRGLFRVPAMHELILLFEPVDICRAFVAVKGRD